MDHLFSARRPDLIIINNKKERKLAKLLDFAIPAEIRLNFKENERKDKYETIIPIVIGAFGTVTKELLN